MFTGEGNPYNLSEINLVDGKNSLNLWGGETPEEKNNTCNIVKGSDGSTFNPYIEKVSTVHINNFPSRNTFYLYFVARMY